MRVSAAATVAILGLAVPVSSKAAKDPFERPLAASAEGGRRTSPSSDVLAQLGEPSLSSVKLADLFGDGKTEIIVTSVSISYPIEGSGHIHVLSLSGNELPGWPVTLNGCPLNGTAAIGDIDGDGNPDVVVQTFGNTLLPLGDPEKVWAFSAAGILKSGFPVGISSATSSKGTGLFGNSWTPSPALADLDADGALEIIAISMGVEDIANQAAVVALKGNGTKLFRTSLPRSVPGSSFFDEYPHYSVPVVGHLLGNGAPDIIVGLHSGVTSPPRTTFFAISSTGAILPGWPVTLAGKQYTDGVIETGALGDLNWDGHDEFIVNTPRVGKTPPRLYVFDGAGHVLAGFPKDVPGSGSILSYPVLADVDHDGFLDLVTFEDADLTNHSTDPNYHLVAYDRLGAVISDVNWPAINDFQFGQGINQQRLSLAENAAGQVCAVFTIPQFVPNQNNLQIQARCLNGDVVPGFPIVLPSLCADFGCQDASSVALARDAVASQVFAVLVDVSGNVRRRDIFDSTKPIRWGQFQYDASGGGRLPEPLSFTDDPMTAGTTPVRAIHFIEARREIDFLRNRCGLPGFSWTDPVISPGATVVKAVHLAELRSALQAVYISLGRPAPAYTHPTVTPGAILIGVIDIAEIRAAIAAVW